MDDEAPHATTISPLHRASSGRSPKTLRRDKRRDAQLPSYQRHEVAARQGSSRVDVSEPRGRSSARRSIGLLPKRLRNGKTSSFSEPRRTLHCLRSRRRTRARQPSPELRMRMSLRSRRWRPRPREWCGRAGSRLAGDAAFVAVERARPGQVQLRAVERTPGRTVRALDDFEVLRDAVTGHGDSLGRPSAYAALVREGTLERLAE